MPSNPDDGVLVRRATIDDAGDIAHLRWQFSGEGRTPTVERDAFLWEMATTVREYLESGRWTIWIAVKSDSGRLIGTAFLQRIAKVPRPYPRAPAWGYVTNVYVVPEHRNSGIGRRILDTLIGETRDEGMDTLLLWPSRRAVPFYLRAGFVTPPSALELELVDDA